MIGMVCWKSLETASGPGILKVFPGSIFLQADTVVQWLVFAISHLQGFQVNPELNLLFVWSFVCSPHIHVGFLQVC